MTAELGHLATVLALMVALVQTTVPLVGARMGWSDWMDAIWQLTAGGGPSSDLAWLVPPSSKGGRNM